VQPQVGGDFLDHRQLQDGRDDLQLPSAAVLAVLHNDVQSEAPAKANWYSSYVALTFMVVVAAQRPEGVAAKKSKTGSGKPRRKQ